MKKITFILFLIVQTINTNAQTIEIIDAIAGTLLPGITTGVKEIINEFGKNNKKDEAKHDFDSLITSAKLELVSSLDKEILNINIIRSVFTESRKANSTAGALKAITNRNLISFMKITDNIEAKKQIILLFTQEWNSLYSTLAEIKKIPIESLDPNLQFTLVQEKDKINDALQRITTINGFTSGSISWTGDMKMQEADGRIIAIENASDHINKIHDAVDNISRLVDTRLQTYRLSFEELKRELKE